MVPQLEDRRPWTFREGWKSPLFINDNCFERPLLRPSRNLVRAKTRFGATREGAGRAATWMSAPQTRLTDVVWNCQESRNKAFVPQALWRIRCSAVIGLFRGDANACANVVSQYPRRGHKVALRTSSVLALQSWPIDFHTFEYALDPLGTYIPVLRQPRRARRSVSGNFRS
jgi:hypothetical protein